MTHAAARHSYLHNRSLRKKSVALHILAAAGSAGGYFPDGSVFGSSLILAPSVSSQNMERDADRLGLDLMMRGKYDPAAMPATFQRMDEKLKWNRSRPSTARIPNCWSGSRPHGSP